MYLLKVNFTKKLTFGSAASNKHNIKSLNVDIHFQKRKKRSNERSPRNFNTLNLQGLSLWSTNKNNTKSLLRGGWVDR